MPADILTFHSRKNHIKGVQYKIWQYESLYFFELFLNIYKLHSVINYLLTFPVYKNFLVLLCAWLFLIESQELCETWRLLRSGSCDLSLKRIYLGFWKLLFQISICLLGWFESELQPLWELDFFPKKGWKLN